jgi:hypothetical protein
MRYRVTGTSDETGENRTLTVEADTEKAATEAAIAQGVIPFDVSPEHLLTAAPVGVAQRSRPVPSGAGVFGWVRHWAIWLLLVIWAVAVVFCGVGLAKGHPSGPVLIAVAVLGAPVALLLLLVRHSWVRTDLAGTITAMLMSVLFLGWIGYQRARIIDVAHRLREWDDLKLIYSEYYERCQRGRPPANADELIAGSALPPSVQEALRTQRYVVSWGYNAAADLDKLDKDAVLAYSTAVYGGRRVALDGIGSVGTFTEEEFAGRPKVRGK